MTNPADTTEAETTTDDSTVATSDYSIRVSADAMEAFLCLPEGQAHDLDELLRDIAERHGLEKVDRAAVELALQNPDGSEHAIAQGTPPLSGQAGGVEWLGEFFESHALTLPDGSVDHYHHTKSSVFEGQPLLRLHPPTKGEAGRDVHGQEIAAEAGEAIALTPDPSVAPDPGDAQVFVAQRAGMVEFDEPRIKICDVLEVDAVDWATGAIDFEGSVRIRKDVGARFEVFGGESVLIQGSVESARVESDGRIEIVGGVLGNGNCVLSAGRELILTYARDAQISCGGQLVAKRELLWCDGEVGQDLLLEEGRIVGGEWLVGGTVYARELGSREEVTTRIRLGASLDQSRSLRKLARDRRRLQDRLQQFAREHGPRLREAAAEGETKPELQSLLDRQVAMRREARRARRKEWVLRKRLRQRELRSQVIVGQKIFAGTHIDFELAQESFEVKKSIEGPVRLHLVSGKVAVERLETMPKSR